MTSAKEQLKEKIIEAYRGCDAIQGDGFEFQVWDLSYDQHSPIPVNLKTSIKSLYKQAQGWWLLSDAGDDRFVTVKEWAKILSKHHAEKVIASYIPADIEEHLKAIAAMNYSSQEVCAMYRQVQGAAQ